MRILQFISSTFLLPLCFVCSSPGLVAVAADTATGKSDIAVSVDRLVQEANQILNRARQLFAAENYRLAEKDFSRLLKPPYSSILTPKLSVAIYVYLSDIYNKLGDADLSLQMARLASDISLSIDEDPYESWPSIKYGIAFLKHWYQVKTAKDIEVEPEDPLIDILQIVDRKLKLNLRNRDQKYLASVASKLSLGYWNLSTYFAKKKSVSLSLDYASRALGILNKYNPDDFERKYNLLNALSIAYKSKYSVPNSKISEKLYVIEKEIFSLSRRLYGESDDRTLLALLSLSDTAKASSDFEGSIEYAKLHYNLTSGAYGVHNLEAINSLESLALAYFSAGQDGLRAKTTATMIGHAKIVYGPNSAEYVDLLIESKNGLVGGAREFVEKELLRLEVANSSSSSAPELSRDELLQTIDVLIDMDANKWGVEQYFKLYYAMIRPHEHESIPKKDALDLSVKFIQAAINIWGENTSQHLQSVSVAAFFSSCFDISFGSKIFLELEELASNNFAANPGILSGVYLKIADHWRKSKDNPAYNEYIEKYLKARFLYYKNVLAYMGTEQRLNQMQADDSVFDAIYANAVSGRLSASVAAFALINRNGLLAELERKYNIVESADQVSLSLAAKIRRLNAELSESNLAPIRRKILAQTKFDLESKLASKHGFSSEIFDVIDLEKVIPEDSVLTQFKLVDMNLVASDPDYQYIAILSSPTDSPTVVRIGSATKINKLVHDLLQELVDKSPGYEQVANSLYQELFLPIDQYLREKNIIFVLDSDLHLLPLALEELRVSDGKDISLLSSSRDLFADDSASALSESPVIVANPDYGAAIESSIGSYETSSHDLASSYVSGSRSLVGMKWESLPASKSEGDALYSILGGKYLFGSNATKKAVLDSINSPSILHIATHAYYATEDELGPRDGIRNIATDSLLRAGVVLAGANHMENKADSYLTALEVSGLNLSGTSLVTLSACDTALGNVLGSEGIFGLQRALSVAGSKSTLLSLWKVDDNSTSDFMKRFYSKLVQGMDKFDALEQVREEFRSHPVPAWRHPYYWAAFRLAGDAGPIPSF